MNTDNIKFWEHNVSDKTKKAVYGALDGGAERGIEMDANLVDVGLTERKVAAKKKCAERRMRRKRKEAVNAFQARQEFERQETTKPLTDK
jgi:hypothetical protein